MWESKRGKKESVNFHRPFPPSSHPYIDIHTPTHTDTNRGFGFVHYESAEDAAAAIDNMEGAWVYMLSIYVCAFVFVGARINVINQYMDERLALPRLSIYRKFEPEPALLSNHPNPTHPNITQPNTQHHSR